MAILVATPGRLLDHLMHCRKFLVKFLKVLIIDEADRLLDEGFEKQIVQIFEKMPGMFVRNLP